jgi:peptidoglycan L-alanyl-D-glutamate endopeptidase CwlK
MQNPISDSKYAFKEAVAGKEIPRDILDTLTLIDITYLSFDTLIHQGQLVIHRKVAQELVAIFNELLKQQFPIAHAIPIVAYSWDDDASMAANNTSAFNYRLVHGTNQLSNHSYGLAVDINTVLNPYVRRDGTVMPPGATYELSKPGTITPEVVEVFKSYEWEWGGDWERKDWQHFQKP